MEFESASRTLPLVLSIISTVVACVALVRPEVATQIKRRFNKVEFYPAGRIEIGYSSFGPTFGVHGTLVGKYSDQLVTSMEIKVIRERDSATHLFQWAIVRSLNVAQAPQHLEIASPLIVRVAEPRKINFQFHDQETKEMFFDDLKMLQQKFREHLIENNIIASSETESAMQSVRQQFRDENDGLLNEVFNKLGSSFYWERGNYNASVTINVADPVKKFTWPFKFTFSDEDSKSLLLNRIAMIEEAMNAQNVIYGFANPKYE